MRDFFCRLKRPSSRFPSHFCFLVIVILLSIVLSVLFLMAVVSLRSCFSMYSSSRCIDASALSSVLASTLPPSFLDTYSLSTSSLGCNALCTVISVLVLWPISLSSSLSYVRKGPEYLTRGTTQVLARYYYYLLIRAFHINVSWWFFTGVWVTVSLFKSPGLFLVFWPFSIMLSFGWSPLVHQLPSPPVPLVIL